MRALLKLMISLALFFAITFIAIKLTGVVTLDKIQAWLTAAQEWSSLYVALTIVALLFADLFIAMPTLTIMLLSGFMLGHSSGFSTVMIGLLLVGCGGYFISTRLGTSILNRVIKDIEQRQKAVELFNEHGITVILLSRAVPILPEVSACMAGITRLPFLKFLTAWLISTVPYAAIATYAGSISSPDNPKPAVLAAVGLTTLLWSAWYLFKRLQNRA